MVARGTAWVRKSEAESSVRAVTDDSLIKLKWQKLKYCYMKDFLLSDQSNTSGTFWKTLVTFIGITQKQEKIHFEN